MKKIVVLFVALLISNFSNAWVISTNVTVKEVIVWENLDTGGLMHFNLSDGRWCYVPNGQKSIQTLILSLYISGKTIAEIHCYDNADSNSGGSVAAAHKMHRIIAK